MATTSNAAWMESWQERQRCRGRVTQHVCRDGCDWIDEPVDTAMMTRKVLVTPTIAAKWLERNSINRSFSRDAARTLTAEMSAGNWSENGEAIIFDSDGVLCDGQHRLQAVVNSGHEYTVPVVTGIAPEARPTVDTGRRRNGGQNLQMAGEKNASLLSSVLLLWRGYLAGDPRIMTSPNSIAPENRMTVPRIMAELELHPTLRIAVSRSIALRAAGAGQSLVPPSEAALVWHAIVTSGNAPERADAFLGSVLSGYNLSEGSPIIALRRRLVDQAGPGLRRDKMEKLERIALVLKAWLLWSTGQSRQVLRWDASTEPFPFLD